MTISLLCAIAKLTWHWTGQKNSAAIKLNAQPKCSQTHHVVTSNNSRCL